MNETAKRVRVVDERILSDNWYLLKTTTFDFLRADGTWQRQHRETYDRGNYPEIAAGRYSSDEPQDESRGERNKGEHDHHLPGDRVAGQRGRVPFHGDGAQP